MKNIIITSVFLGLLSVILAACDNIGMYDYANMMSSRTVAIYMFTAPSHNGYFDVNNDLDARPELDAYCSSNKSFSFKNIRAFISVGDYDAIKDMPANYNVPQDKEVWDLRHEYQIAQAWDDLLDGAIPVSLGAVLGVSSDYWTGSNMDGTIDTSATCNNWTDGTGSYDGRIGYASYIDSQWLAADSYACGGSYPVLCIGW